MREGISRKKAVSQAPNPDIEKADVAYCADLERFFKRGIPDSLSYLPIPYNQKKDPDEVWPRYLEQALDLNFYQISIVLSSIFFCRFFNSDIAKG